MTTSKEFRQRIRNYTMVAMMAQIKTQTYTVATTSVVCHGYMAHQALLCFKFMVAVMLAM